LTLPQRGENEALKIPQWTVRRLSKIGFLASLLGTYTWITVIAPFVNNGMPTGWDTGAYLAWTNTLRIAGIQYVLSPRFFQYSGLNVVPGLLLYITTSLVSSDLLGYVLFQTITLGLFFTSTLCLIRKFRYSFVLTLLSIVVLLSSYAFIRMTRDLYANLLCIVFLQFALVLLFDLRKGPFSRTSIGLYLSTLLMLVTDVEIGGFGVLVLVISIIVGQHGETWTSVRRTALPILGGLSTGFLLWLPFIMDYLKVSTLLAGAPGSADWPAILLELGGLALIPLWGVGFAYSLWQLKRKNGEGDSFILVGWVLTVVISTTILVLFHPEIAFRVALLLPLCFLLPKGVQLLGNISQKIRTRGVLIRIIGLVVLLVVSSVVAATSSSTFMSQTTSGVTSPFFTEQQYHTLHDLGNFLGSKHFDPSAIVFLIYPENRITQPQAVSSWTNLYDNWIYATIGPHITYYGTLENFTFHVPIQFASVDEQSTFQLYSSMFATSMSYSKVNLVIVSFFYAGNQLGLSQFSTPVKGVFLDQVSLPRSEGSGWMPAFYSIAQTGGYFRPENWSLSGYALESYTPVASTPFNNFRADFSIYSSVTHSYNLDIRMFDFGPSNSPILVSIDNAELFAINYYGSLTPRVFSGPLGNLTIGYHLLTLSTILGVAHNLDIDSIQISSQNVTLVAAPLELPSNWTVDDGTGIINGPDSIGMITVSGNPDLGGLLGVETTLTSAIDFSGSKFVLFQLNSSAHGTISIWLNDTSGNIIRYDSQYDISDQFLFLAIPIVPYLYSSSSTNLPDFSSIHSVELGLTVTSQSHLELQFTTLVLVANPIPVNNLPR